MESKYIENEEVSLKDLLKKIKDWRSYLLTQWRIILIACLIGSGLGLTISLIKKPIYTATLSFVLEEDKASGGLGGALGLASSFGLDLGGSGGGMFTAANLTELFKSRLMVEKTLLSPIEVNGKTISFAELYIQDNKWREGWKEKPKLANIQFLPAADKKLITRVHDSILGVMYENLTHGEFSVGQKDKKVSLISIEVFSTNEFFAKNFCEALAKQISDFYIDTKSKKARINMAILERQVDSIRGELNGAITGVAVANDNTFNLNPALNVRRAPSARRQVDVQANTAILTELVKQSELAKVTLRKETPLIQVIDRPLFPLKKYKIGKLKGIIIGGAISGFLILIILIFRKIIKDWL